MTIQQHWDEYRSSTFPKATDWQLDEARRVFFAGAISTLAEVLCADEEVPLNDRVARLENLRDEAVSACEPHIVKRLMNDLTCDKDRWRKRIADREKGNAP